LAANSSVLYFQGTQDLGGGALVAFGDDLRCAGGPTVLLKTAANVGGVSSYPTLGETPVSVRGGCVAGDVRTRQAWYRNAAPAFCTSATYNLTNGVTRTWTL
jgi:hypothetical protein